MYTYTYEFTYIWDTKCIIEKIAKHTARALIVTIN